MQFAIGNRPTRHSGRAKRSEAGPGICTMRAGPISPAGGGMLQESVRSAFLQRGGGPSLHRKVSRIEEVMLRGTCKMLRVVYATICQSLSALTNLNFPIRGTTPFHNTTESSTAMPADKICQRWKRLTNCSIPIHPTAASYRFRVPLHFVPLARNDGTRFTIEY
jgi:hypothetical protein